MVVVLHVACSPHPFLLALLISRTLWGEADVPLVSNLLHTGTFDWFSGPHGEHLRGLLGRHLRAHVGNFKT